MILSIQIKSLILSFLYGIFYNFSFNIFYHLLFTRYSILNILTNLVFNIVIFGLYFYLLYIINNGIIHIYFFLALFLGFLVYSNKSVKLRVKWKKIRI